MAFAQDDPVATARVNRRAQTDAEIQEECGQGLGADGGREVPFRPARLPRAARRAFERRLRPAHPALPITCGRASQKTARSDAPAKCRSGASRSWTSSTIPRCCPTSPNSSARSCASTTTTCIFMPRSRQPQPAPRRPLPLRNRPLVSLPRRRDAQRPHRRHLEPDRRAGPGAGGFTCVPGSHKSNFLKHMPADVARFEAATPIGVVQPPMEAGDVLIFTEALIHGTAEWKANHERRHAALQIQPPAFDLGQIVLQPGRITRTPQTARNV